MSMQRNIEPGIKRLVISDLHIGSRFYKSEALLKLLDEQEFDELVLAGDIIDLIKVPTFTKTCAAIINKLSKNTRIKYIVGNHDISFEEWDGLNVLGVSFVRDYHFKCGNRMFHITHGDLYERGLVRFKSGMKLISIFHDILERWFNIDLTTFFHEKIKPNTKAYRIKTLLEQTSADVFIMGHTHSPEAVIWVDQNLKIKTYVNTGDWITHSTYVTINESGEVRLRKLDA